MTISYQLIAGISGRVKTVRRMEEGKPNACIPFDPTNTDYQEYLAWLEEGNTPLPADSE